MTLFENGNTPIKKSISANCGYMAGNWHRLRFLSRFNDIGTNKSHKQKGDGEPLITTAFQTLQVYRAAQLKRLLEHHGFEVIQQTAMDGSALKPEETERILTVAKKSDFRYLF